MRLAAAWLIGYAGLGGISPAFAAGPPPAMQPAGITRPPASPATATDAKIDSHLLDEISRHEPRGGTRGAAPPTGVRVDRRDRALVDVRVPVTTELQKHLRATGATIVSTSVEYRSIVAWVPLARVRRLASLPAVIAIVPAAETTTVK